MYAPAAILAMVPHPLTAPIYLGLMEMLREKRREIDRGRAKRNIPLENLWFWF